MERLSSYAQEEQLAYLDRCRIAVMQKSRIQREKASAKAQVNAGHDINMARHMQLMVIAFGLLAGSAMAFLTLQQSTRTVVGWVLLMAGVALLIFSIKKTADFNEKLKRSPQYAKKATDSDRELDKVNDQYGDVLSVLPREYRSEEAVMYIRDLVKSGMDFPSATVEYDKLAFKNTLKLLQEKQQEQLDREEHYLELCKQLPAEIQAAHNELNMLNSEYMPLSIRYQQLTQILSTHHVDLDSIR